MMNYDFPPKTKVLVVDEHFLSAQLVTVFLHRESGYSVVAECVTGFEALNLAEKYTPDIVTIPLELPDALETIELLLIRSLRVLVYTGTKNPILLADGLKASPHGFVHKSEDISVLSQAMQHVAQGGVYFSPVATKLAQGFRFHPDRTPQESLKPQERQILRLVAKGLSSKQVAAA